MAQHQQQLKRPGSMPTFPGSDLPAERAFCADLEGAFSKDQAQIEQVVPSSGHTIATAQEGASFADAYQIVIDQPLS
ncbi:MAG: hypothetical protein HGA65_02505 [Oscillochloris sp.]|nr:hypothetical protein [Oscillochloris sp.]